MLLDFFKAIPHYLLPKHGLTLFAGLVANNKQIKIKNYIIQRFIRKYHVNMDEALVKDPTAYACFNDFFIRHLSPACRPQAQADITCPVDGTVSALGSITQGQLLQAKGRYYSVQTLLACDEKVAQTFVDGRFATLYLSPKDYHRVHMPVDAELVSMTYIPGALFSVQPTTVRAIPQLFARNARLVVLFKTAVGPMAVVLVGATIVGAIGTPWHGDIRRSKTITPYDYQGMLFRQGEELGYFKLGSTAIVLFAKGDTMQWDKELTPGSTVRYGQAMGTFVPETAC